MRKFLSLGLLFLCGCDAAIKSSIVDISGQSELEKRIIARVDELFEKHKDKKEELKSVLGGERYYVKFVGEITRLEGDIIRSHLYKVNIEGKEYYVTHGPLHLGPEVQRVK